MSDKKKTYLIHYSIDITIHFGLKYSSLISAKNCIEAIEEIKKDLEGTKYSGFKILDIKIIE